MLPHVRLGDLWAVYRGAEGDRPRRGQRRARHRHHRLPRPRLLRARQRPLDPDRAAHLRAAGRPAGPDRRPQDQDLRLHQRLRPPSRRPHRHPGRGEARRGALPAPARRLGRGRRRARRYHRARASAPTASSMRSRRSWTGTWSCAPAPTSRSLPPTAASAPRPSRRRSMPPPEVLTLASPSTRASPTSPRAPSARGEGRGEGQPQTPSEPRSTPHPNPLPTEEWGEGIPAAPVGERDPNGPIWRGDTFHATLGFKRRTNEALPDAPIILKKAQWLAERDRLAGRNAPLGLRLEPGEAIDDIAADLARFALIALSFPKFSDGRAFSTARLLREKHGFAGELRAVGNVLSDQIPFMRRVGFDSLEVTHAPDPPRAGRGPHSRRDPALPAHRPPRARRRHTPVAAAHARVTAAIFPWSLSLAASCRSAELRTGTLHLARRPITRWTCYAPVRDDLNGQFPFPFRRRRGGRARRRQGRLRGLHAPDPVRRRPRGHPPAPPRPHAGAHDARPPLRPADRHRRGAGR